MVLCPECGNKRCPRATDHNNDCTNSNEPGQPGNSYPARHVTDALTEEMARLREDAARYRWLRSQTKISDSRFYDMPKISSLNFTGTGRDYNSKFDACIDNTRKKKHERRASGEGAG